MTTITLHGQLGKKIGKVWKLNVKTVSEAMSAIEVLSKRNFFSHLLEKDKEGAKYQVLINGKPVMSEKPLDNKNATIGDVKQSEFYVKRRKLETIDIIPLIQGSDEGIIGIVVGVILIVVGIFTSWLGIGTALIAAGVGLVAGGIVSLLSSPPKFDDFRDFNTSTGTQSYLFSGPQNTTREGGPVPLGYGRLIVGSQVIQASYDIQDILSSKVNAPVQQQEIGEF